MITSPRRADELYKLIQNRAGFDETQGKIWVVLKPEDDKLVSKGFLTRLYHAWLVFRCKATAFQYYEDVGKK